MRKESSNQFTEGLVCDLNPINTPNTVLTDALNATIITYDGNEFSLQNDRGNYPLENCRLKPNYIPVGLKEHGDILYIVSYNPLNDHVEIGSYPSPMEVESSNENDTTLELKSILEEAKDGDNYSKLIEKCEIKIWTSDNEEDSKLYPGDKYKIEEVNKSDYKYETLEYYIVDSDRKKHNISDLINLPNTLPDENGYHNVSWQIPGWLAAQYRLATFDDFTMSIRSLIAPSIGMGETIDCKASLNFQFKISDKLLLPTENNDVKTDIGIKLVIKSSEKTKVERDISLFSGKFIDWYSESRILWVDEKDIDIPDLKLGDTLEIIATPYIIMVSGEVSKTIVYDSFEETTSIFLNDAGNYSDFTIGNELWKFYIDDDDNYLYLEYDVVGPYITTSEVGLYYRIFEPDAAEPLTQWKAVSDYTGITNQGVGIIPFDNESGFIKEGIYIIEFAFYKNNVVEIPDSLQTIKKMIIASEIFADFVGEYSNFNDINFDKWSSKYKDSIKSSNWTVDYTTVGEGEQYTNYLYGTDLQINGLYFANKSLKNLWNLNYKDDDKGLFDSTSWNDIKDRTDRLIEGEENELHVTLKHDTKVLQGPLWSGSPKIKIDLKSYLENVELSVDRLTLSEQLITGQIKSVFGQSLDISYLDQDSFKYVSNIKSLENIPVSHIHFEGYKVKNLNDGIRYAYYNLGEYPNKLEYTEILGKRGSLSEGVIGINGSLAKAITESLGQNQMGVLLSTICLTEKVGNRMQYRHGENVLWEDRNGSGTYLFTYLVFRRSPSSNSDVLIPIKSRGDLWNIFIGSGNVPKLDSDKREYDVLDSLTGYLNSLRNNIKICVENNSVKVGKVVKINVGAIKDLPVCDLNVYTEPFTSWIYSTSAKKYDILTQNGRELLSKNSKEFCGQLFTGNITSFKGNTFFETSFENSNLISNSNGFENVIKNANTINDSVFVREDETGLLTEMIRRGENTKGIYWINESKPNFIEPLNLKYASSASNYICADSANLEDANVFIVKEKDKIVFSRVDTEIYG